MHIIEISRVFTRWPKIHAVGALTGDAYMNRSCQNVLLGFVYRRRFETSHVIS